MRITIEIESSADVHDAVTSLMQLAERLGFVGAEPTSTTPTLVSHPVDTTAFEKVQAEEEPPEPAQEDFKPLRGKNAKAAAERMTAAGERDDDYERLPQKWRDHVDNELMPKEAAVEAAEHKDQDSDLDPPSSPGDITIEDLKVLGEMLVTSLPQGATQLKVLGRIGTILTEADAVVDGKPRFKFVPEDRVAAVHAKLTELQAELQSELDPSAG